MGVYLYKNNTENELSNAYIGIPNPESITLNKSSISLTTIGQTEQLTATLTPTVCDQRITWTTSDSTIATVSTTGLVTCVTPGTATITATTSNGLTATCGVANGWQPGVNTVMYYPFTTDQLDKVGSSSLSGTGTQETLGYTFNANEYIYVNDPSTSCRFISVWVKYNSSNGVYTQSPSTYIGQILYNFYHHQASWNHKFQIQTSSSGWSTSSGQSTSTGIWYHIAMGYDGSKVCCYINGNKVWEATSGVYSPGTMVLGRYINETISEFIGESVCWTDQEVSDYYNQTKSNYGL